MGNKSIKHKVITWTKRNCHSQGRKTKIGDDSIIELIFWTSLEKYLCNAHGEVGICVTTKEYIGTKSNTTEKIR
jgi:hypothetical protein